MDRTASAIRDAHRNLVDAERTLQSIDESLRRNDADLARVREWISAAKANLNAATASGDPSIRNHALQSLADAHDSLGDFERVGAKFAHLQMTARSTADRARDVLREAQSIAAETQKLGFAGPATDEPPPGAGPTG